MTRTTSSKLQAGARCGLPAMGTAALVLAVSVRAESPFAALPPGAPAPYVVAVINAHDAVHSTANGINNRGDVCGEWYNADYSVNEGVLHSSAHLQRSIAPATGYGGISMLGINDAGDTAGFMDSDGFVRINAVFTTLAPPGATVTVARGLNNSGTVVGDSSGPVGDVAWTWNSAAGYGTLAGLPGYTGHGAAGINTVGEIIGHSTRTIPGEPDTTETSQWLFSGGTFTPVTWPGTTSFSLRGINDHGDLLVFYRTAATSSLNRYAVRSGGSFREITFTLPAGLTDAAVSGFNNCGEIAGYCRDGSGRSQAFRGRPAWLPEVNSTHADVALKFSAGQLSIEIRDADIPAVYAPNRVITAAAKDARRLIPSNPGFSFLGQPGASTWIVPQVQEPGLPWLGHRSLIPGGVLQGPAALSLESVSGPGHFSLYSNSGLGGPAVAMNSADGINSATDRITLNSGAHVHYNWAFSAPGLWKLRFRVSGTPADGGAAIVSAPQELTFWLEPGSVFPVHMGTPVMGAASVQIPLSAEVGRECVLRTSTDLMNWSVSQQFITTARDFTLTQPTTAARIFFRADIR